MCGEKSSLAEKVGVTPDSAIFAKSKVQFFDDLSDDEEYQKMTEEERNKMMKPKLDFGNSFLILASSQGGFLIAVSNPKTCSTIHPSSTRLFIGLIPQFYFVPETKKRFGMTENRTPDLELSRKPY